MPLVCQVSSPLELLCLCGEELFVSQELTENQPLGPEQETRIPKLVGARQDPLAFQRASPGQAVWSETTGPPVGHMLAVWPQQGLHLPGHGLLFFK